MRRPFRAPLIFALALLATGPPAALAADVTPPPTPIPVPIPAPGCACPAPCPTGPPAPLMMPPPWAYPPQPMYPAVYLRPRSVHDGPAGYRSAPWHPVPEAVSTTTPPARTAELWWPW